MHRKLMFAIGTAGIVTVVIFSLLLYSSVGYTAAAVAANVITKITCAAIEQHGGKENTNNNKRSNHYG